ncbi:MAG: hypothetical protein R3A79_03990 [Nannocystaceae bacterium]
MLASLVASVIATASPGISPTLVSAGLSCASGEVRSARATLTVDTSALREEGAGPAVAHQLRARGESLLRRDAVVPFGGSWDPVVLVTVEPLRAPAIGYRSAIAIERGAPGYASDIHELRCDLCTEGELIAQVLGALDVIVPQLFGRVDERAR